MDIGQSVGIVVIAGLVVRELTQVVVESLRIRSRAQRLLLSVLFTVIVAGVVEVAGLGEWSEELIGGIWAAAWGAHTVKGALRRPGEVTQRAEARPSA